MAEVLAYWPESRKPAPATFNYPWKDWMDLDDNGVGDIWLVELGVDWPADSNIGNFRSLLYTRASKVTARRKRDAPMVLMRVKGTDTVKKVPRYKELKVKIRSVSDTQLAFQFYEGFPGTPPPEDPPVPIKAALPTRRTNLRRRKTGSVLARV